MDCVLACLQVQVRVRVKPYWTACVRACAVRLKSPWTTCLLVVEVASRVFWTVCVRAKKPSRRKMLEREETNMSLCSVFAVLRLG